MRHSSTALRGNIGNGPICDSTCGVTHNKTEAADQVHYSGRDSTPHRVKDGLLHVFIDNGLIVRIRTQDHAGLPEPASRTGRRMRITTLDTLARLTSQFLKGALLW